MTYYHHPLQVCCDPAVTALQFRAIEAARILLKAGLVRFNLYKSLQSPLSSEHLIHSPEYWLCSERTIMKVDKRKDEMILILMISLEMCQ